MKKTTLAIFSLVAALLIIPAISWGADENIEDPGPDWTSLNNSATNCFDYYQFQSVQVSIGTSDGPYRPGDKIKFSGELINKNSYPVVDGNLFVRIGRNNPNYQADGRYIADEFFALEKVNLDTEEKKAVSFEWVVPQGMVNGQYTADYFFSVGKKFNLAGLPFSNEVVGGSTQFTISNSSAEIIKIDLAQTTVNGGKYRHVGNWPIIEPNSKVVIEQPIQNLSNIKQKVEVAYDLYYWDGLDQADKIDSKKETIEVLAKSKQTLTYTVSAMKDTVYYLKITAISSGQKSIVNVRLASEQNRPRLNYPALTKFPIKQGEKFSLFSCFHNTSGQSTEGKMTVVLSDKDGREVGRLDYSGDISSQMQADAKEIVANKDLEYLKLLAEMRDKDGKVVDKYETVYDCKYFNKCQTNKDAIVQKGNNFMTNPIFWFFGGLVFVAILATLWLRNKKNNSDMGGGISALLLMFFLSFGVFLISGGSVNAAITKTATPSSSYSHSAWGRSIANGTVVANHSVSMSKDSYSLMPGECVDFSWSDTSSYVSFLANGGSWDTPYAYAGDPATNNWLGIGDNAQPTMDYMLDLNGVMTTSGNINDNYVYVGAHSNYVQLITSAIGGNPGRITFTAEAPVVSMVSSNANISCTGMRCCAVTTGSATLTTSISTTPVRLWSIIDHNDGHRPCTSVTSCCPKTGGAQLAYIGSYWRVDAGYPVGSPFYGEKQCNQKFWMGPAWINALGKDSDGFNYDAISYSGGYSYLSQDGGPANVTTTMNLPASSINWVMSVTPPPPTCPDGFCDRPAENNANCPDDCSASCGDGICDRPAENSTNCPDDCSCLPVPGFNSGTSLFSPNSVVKNTTNSFNVKCDYGVAGVDSISPVLSGGWCRFDDFIGTVANFTCDAGGTIGDYNVACSVRDGSNSDNCPLTNDLVGDLTIDPLCQDGMCEGSESLSSSPLYCPEDCSSLGFELEKSGDPVVYINRDLSDGSTKKSSTIKIKASPDLGFSGTINFSASAPTPAVSGAVSTFFPTSLSGFVGLAKEVSFYVTIPNITPDLGTKKITITGTSGSIVKTLDVFLRVIDSDYQNK